MHVSRASFPRDANNERPNLLLRLRPPPILESEWVAAARRGTLGFLPLPRSPAAFMAERRRRGEME